MQEREGRECETLQKIRVMKYEKVNNSQEDLFRSRLSNQLNMNHELIKLSKQIDWSFIEEEIKAIYPERQGAGRYALPIRLVIGILILQHMNNLSDEEVVKRWLENPYWQYFCGYDYLQTEFPLDASSLTRWRKRIGSKGLEKVLEASIQTALNIGATKKRNLEELSTDTTVMPKDITYPTDTKLLHKAMLKMVSLSKKHGLKLRQSYKFKTKKLVLQISKHIHSKKFKLANKGLKALKTIVGRLMRDCARKIEDKPDLQKEFANILRQAEHLITRKKDDKNKIYSLHEEEAVSCISKGKAHKKYEFGCKVGLSFTNKGLGLCTAIKTFHSNPHDSKTLKPLLEMSENISSVKVRSSFLDKGFKGHGVKDIDVYISGQRKGVTPKIRKQIKRRQAIEAHIGHAKSECKLGLSRLKGKIGDEINAVMTAIAYNFRQLMNFITSIFAKFIASTICLIFNFCYDTKYLNTEN